MMLLYFILTAFIATVTAEFTLNIIHHNDIHAYIMPIMQSGKPCEPEQNQMCYGGISRLASLTKQLQLQENSLHVNAGDMYQGTAWYTFFKWQPLLTFTNMLNMDAMTIGNHEFDDGVEGLIPYVANVTVPVVAANVDLRDEPELAKYIKPSIVLDYNGTKVAIIGYVTPHTKFLAFPGGVKFLNEEEALIAETERLKKEGVKIFIALGHSGYSRDKEIAENVPLLDVVIGGHSHSFLYSGQNNLDTPQGPYPTVINHLSGKKILVVQAMAYTKYVGKLKVVFGDDGDVVSWEGEPILLDNFIPPDPEFEAEVNRWLPKFGSATKQVLGETLVLLDHKKCRYSECNIGNLFTDAVMAKVVEGTKTSWSKVTGVLLNSGGFRISIDPGEIKAEDITAIHPFNNGIDLATMKGKTLREVMEHSVRNTNPLKNIRPGAFLQMSGIKVVYDLCGEPGNRVREVEILCSDCLIPEYKPVDDNKIYTIAVSDYISRGGDGFNVLTSKAVKIQHTGLKTNPIIEEYISKRSPLIIGINERISYENDGTKCKKKSRVFVVTGTPIKH